MIINTITSREDRATITAIIGVSSENQEKTSYYCVVQWKAQVECSGKIMMKKWACSMLL
jgi:hypothetical protein